MRWKKTLTLTLTLTKRTLVKLMREQVELVRRMTNAQLSQKQ